VKFEFPFMQLPSGIVRPIITVSIHGPRRSWALDGLIDSGADRSVFPSRVARQFAWHSQGARMGDFSTAAGATMPFRLADATLELRTPGCAVRWRATIAFADEPLSTVPH